MAFLKQDDLYKNYDASKADAESWRSEYREYERIANNELIANLDKNLPETSDGSLSASLFKLPKRIVSSKLKGFAKTTDRDDAWLTELANMQWENQIIPNANTQAPFHRKWKDAVRKAAVYGSVPLVTLFVERGNYTGSDFIVALPQDVHLEQGKISDYDSDVIYWDTFYTKTQIESMIEMAKAENRDAKKDGRDSYNRWNIPNLQKLLTKEEERSTAQTPKSQQDKSVKSSGIKLCVVVQRGVDAPFYMYSPTFNLTVREWSNPDPTGDVPIHYLYCYQDFINPYGIGIVKLAGGTQNVLDYMRQADVLATQLGIRPPIEINGDADSVDLDSVVYEQDALWFTGTAKVQRMELGNHIYSELPNRIAMYKNSLNQMLPMGDTSISATAGDPLVSKTPAGVKQQAANLSIDDEDFKDNLYITYAAVAKSMINTHFANMQGTDLMRLSDEEKDVMTKAGIEFPQDTNELEVVWDTARAEFDFEIDTEADKTTDDAMKLEGLTKVVEVIKDPMVLQMVEASMQKNGKKLDVGELYSEIIGLLSDNDKIITDVAPEDQQTDGAQAGQENPAQAQQMQDLQKQIQDLQQQLEEEKQVPYKDAPEDIKRQKEERAGYTPSTMQSPVQTQVDQNTAKLHLQAGQQAHDQTMAVHQANQPQPPAQGSKTAKPAGKKQPSQQSVAQQQNQPDLQGQPDIPENPQDQQDPQVMQDIQAVMKAYNVDDTTAATMLEAERQGFSPEEIIKYVEQNR